MRVVVLLLSSLRILLVSLGISPITCFVTPRSHSGNHIQLQTIQRMSWCHRRHPFCFTCYFPFPHPRQQEEEKGRPRRYLNHVFAAASPFILFSSKNLLVSETMSDTTHCWKTKTIKKRKKKNMYLPFLSSLSLLSSNVLESPSVMSNTFNSTKKNINNTQSQNESSTHNKEELTTIPMSSSSNNSSNNRNVSTNHDNSTLTRDIHPKNSNSPLYLWDLQHLLRPANTFSQFKDFVLNSGGEMTPSITSSSYDLSTRSSSSSSSHSFLSTTTTPSMDATSSSSSKVAFPQASLLTLNEFRKGTIVASTVLLTLLSIVIQPEMWLVSAIGGAFYGQYIATSTASVQYYTQNITAITPTTTIPTSLSLLQDTTTASTTTTATSISSKTWITRLNSKLQFVLSNNPYTHVVFKVGKIMALKYLQIYDILQGIWFMYRTGQLSYEYYKVYSDIDKKYNIQEKMDAWNARFIQGKLNFDTWERENEVARKVLAGLRTVWLVQEKSFNSESFKSMSGGGKRKIETLLGIKLSKPWINRIQKYILFWKRFFHAFWAMTFMGGSSFVEMNILTQEIRQTISSWNLERVSQRIGSAFVALVFVNIIGALFAIAPFFLGSMAILAGSIWPNWIRDLYSQVCKRILFLEEEEDEEKNPKIKQSTWLLPGFNMKKTSISSSSSKQRLGHESIFTFPFFGEPTSRIQDENTKRQYQLVDMNNFHYYIDNQGQKRWYRVGKSPFIKVLDSSRLDKKIIKDENKSTLGDGISRWFQ